MNKRLIIARVALAGGIALVCGTAAATSSTDLAHIHPGDAAGPPTGWVQFCDDNPSECGIASSVQEDASLSPAKLRELGTVNRFFNRSIRPVTDEDQYGVAERWTYASTGKGDCEDYVLEKRRRLQQLGWPISSLLVTVVLNKKQEGHAVLTVVTDKGDYILDNLTDEVLPWSQTGLIYFKRQSAGHPNAWRSLGQIAGVPETITAAAR